MKTMRLLFLMVFGLISFASAQIKPSQKAVIKTPTVNCEECKTRIEKGMFREYGVTSTKVDYRRHTVTVAWLSDRTNIENIKTAIANIGYDADDVVVEPDARKRLPLSCRHNAGDKPVKPKD